MRPFLRDKFELAKICKICREDLIREERYKAEGKDLNDIGNIFEEIGESFTKTFMLLEKEARRLSIDPNNLSDTKDESPNHGKSKIYRLVEIYGKAIERVIISFSAIPIDSDTDLILAASDAFAHSRHYILTKIARALRSMWEEKHDTEDNIEDSKTSALLAYMAIERNARAFLALTSHKPLRTQKRKHLKLAKNSLLMLKIIQDKFFPKEKLIYQEYGTERYDHIFKCYFENNKTGSTQ